MSSGINSLQLIVWFHVGLIRKYIVYFVAFFFLQFWLLLAL